MTILLVALIALSLTAAGAVAVKARQERRAALDSDLRHRMVLNCAKDGILTLSVDGVITGVNPALERIFGYPEKFLLGKNIAVLYEESISEEQTLGFLRKVASNEVAGKTREYKGRRSDGRLILCHVSVTPVALSTHKEFVAIVRDITKLREVEKKKEEFVAMVAHELRTPLTSISASLGLLSHGAGGALPEQAERLMQMAKENCDRLVRMVSDMLDLEKLQAGKMAFEIRPEFIAPLLQKVMQESAGFAAKHGIQLLLKPVDGSLAAPVDPDRLLQVLTNLISNAVKFAEPQSAVTIACVAAGGTNKISVHNYGRPIPANAQKKLFSRFSQVNPSGQQERTGTGLGLSISKEIVEELNGTISFESSEGAGTTFFVELQGCRIAPSENTSSRALPNSKVVATQTAAL